MKFFIRLICLTFIVAIITGCGSKKSGVYNLPPHAWYEQISKDIRDGNLKAANEHYMQFSSEHISSPLLEPTLLILAQSNIHNHKYMEANEYLNQYIRRYGTREKIEYATFLKIKANYESFKRPNRNQNLIKHSINEINNFLINYPQTQYRPLAETMLIKFKLAEFYLDQNIQDLYERTDRNISAKVYEEKIQNSKLKDANLVPPQLPWYRAFFE
ncbi:beta-barrel assembly machinery complex, BamD/YfiO lipoprotein [Campylobacter blaseri]|uniref:Outer membrane protein assembly factor BamD n=1 Tax=Campylobacter blaseri TaxID=2042961 RepID=A0A2P8R206_9BACT|nr:outer membrane protein assembly factor BamD [Campylobacter blaseri]PSM52523.1 outer membrane protein assembly factor BamD [Campylobacter blaseri]PSM54171.1 outer membrane protein assembly factor BamD [Campylobacter blaseri]QKF85821.1 beta-barrel assembly machinery complex, BamD/YfiO lipoprotein [Campylobacter blaseri]